MTSLAEFRFIPYRRGEEALTTAEQNELALQLPEWKVTERDQVKRLEREFRFPDFAQALSFTNRVGALAEEVNHHPSLLTQWGRVTITWWTHEAGGLHRNDFVMAARTDALYSSA
ncbi:4a-hydroxytetrahydrobiopterin dehydratase [Chloroflexota bacterium]